MVWKYVPGDKFDLDTLVGYKEWFEKDLQASQDWYDKIQEMPDSLPGKVDTLKIAQKDITISEMNVVTINNAIASHKE